MCKTSCSFLRNVLPPVLVPALVTDQEAAHVRHPDSFPADPAEEIDQVVAIVQGAEIDHFLIDPAVVIGPLSFPVIDPAMATDRLSGIDLVVEIGPAPVIALASFLVIGLEMATGLIVLTDRIGQTVLIDLG